METKTILSTVATMFAVMLFLSCDNWPRSGPDNYDVADTLTIAEQIDVVMNPQFTTVEEVILYRHDAMENHQIDSLFESIDETTLRNVCHVLLRKNASITKKSIVEEYQANAGVYNNLPLSKADSTSKRNEVNLNATDLGNKRNDSDIILTSYSYRTDTINGKPVKIKIKKEEYYVR